MYFEHCFVQHAYNIRLLLDRVRKDARARAYHLRTIFLVYSFIINISSSVSRDRSFRQVHRQDRRIASIRYSPLGRVHRGMGECPSDAFMAHVYAAYAYVLYRMHKLRVYTHVLYLAHLSYVSTHILRYDDSLSAIVCYFTRISIVRNKKTTIVTITFNYFY